MSRRGVGQTGREGWCGLFDGDAKLAHARRGNALAVTGRPWRLVLADPDTLVRVAIRGLCERAGWRVVAEAETGQGLVTLVEQHQPDVAVTEIPLRELSGLEAIERLRRAGCRTSFVVLTARPDAQAAAWADQAGADGYVGKHEPFVRLADAIEAAGRRQHAAAPFGRTPSGNGHKACFGLGQLSSREREVLQLLAQGASAKEVAANLDISTKTVDAHRRRVMEKLQLASVAHLTRFAIREGLVRLDETPPEWPDQQT